MAYPTLFRIGYQWYRNASDPVNDIDVYGGGCRSIDDTEDIFFTGLIRKRLDANWAVGDNAGGLDTGSRAANTWYYIFAIKRDTGVCDILLSTSISSPTMPANYTKRRLIGAIRTGATNLQLVDTRFVSGSIYVRYLNPVENGLDVNSSCGTGSRTTWQLPNLPRFGDTIYASIVFAGNIIAGASSASQVYVSNPDAADSAPSLTAAPLATISAPAGDNEALSTLLYADRNAYIGARSNVNSTTFKLQVLGYYWPDGANM